MELELIKIALSPQAISRLKDQRIVIHHHRLWLWAEAMIFPFTALVFALYIIPFKNSYVIGAFAIILLLLLLPFRSSIKKLYNKKPALIIDAKGMKLPKQMVAWSEVKNGRMVLNAFGAEMTLQLNDGSKLEHTFNLLQMPIRKVHIHLCKYYSLTQENQNKLKW